MTVERRLATADAPSAQAAAAIDGSWVAARNGDAAALVRSAAALATAEGKFSQRNSLDAAGATTLGLPALSNAAPSSLPGSGILWLAAPVLGGEFTIGIGKDAIVVNIGGGAAGAGASVRVVLYPCEDGLVRPEG
jgi:hypothetical protein